MSVKISFHWLYDLELLNIRSTKCYKTGKNFLTFLRFVQFSLAACDILSLKWFFFIMFIEYLQIHMQL